MISWILKSRTEHQLQNRIVSSLASDSLAKTGIDIRPYHGDDEAAVIALWRACDLVRDWNDPHQDIAAKMTVQPDLFFVLAVDGKLAGTAMAAFDGHRGVVNYLAVDPACQKQGLGKHLMQHIEAVLASMGCAKINVMIRTENEQVKQFYAALGYGVQDVDVLGKWL